MAAIAVVAGETSGDIHAGNLVAAIKGLDPAVDVWAVGGEHLRKAGARVLFPSSEIAAMGVTEVVGKLPAIFRARRAILAEIKANPPDLFVLVDFGGFNLRLAATLKKLSIPVVYYIPPKAWAWGRGRVAKVRERVRRVMTILPFEDDFWKENGVRSDYVGSPIFDHMTDRTRPVEEGVVGLLPGSRRGEINRIWPPMAHAAQLIARVRKLRFLVARAPGLPEGMPDQSLLAGLDFEMLEGGSQEVMERSTACLVASGTATLECALLETPMIVVYNVNPVSLFIAERFVDSSRVSLPNLIAGEDFVPELLQADGEKMAQTLLKLLDSPADLAAMKAKLKAVRNRMGERGASAKAAGIVLEELRGSAPS